MNNSKEFQDAKSIRSGNSHVASRPVSFPPHPIPEGMLSRKMLNQYAVDNPTLPVNLRFSHLFQILAEC